MSKNGVENLEKNYSDEKIQKNFEKGREKIQPFLEKAIKQSEDKNTTENLFEIIKHLNDRVNYWEDRRTYFMHIGIGLSAAAIAGILLVVQNYFSFLDKLGKANSIYEKITQAIIVPGLAGIGIFCFLVLIGSIRLMVKWSTQNNPSYPFTKGYKIWLWQYRFAEATPSDTQFDEHNKEKFESEVEKYCENLYEYKKRYIEANKDEILDQNISQIYLLLTNEKYKIKMVGALRDTLISTLEWSVKIAFLFDILVFITIINWL